MVSMRRKSSIDLAKQKERIERARRMTPEERMQTCINLTKLGLEFKRAQKRLLESVPPQIPFMRATGPGQPAELLLDVVDALNRLQVPLAVMRSHTMAFLATRTRATASCG
jgi:hypothetical protein